MSASEQIRAMLNQLMGTDSNGTDDGNRVKFTDAETRLNLGPCRRTHDVRLRTDFQKAQATKDFGYDLEVKNHLESFIADRDHRIEVAQQKLDEAREASKALFAEKESVVEELQTLIDVKIAEAERLGEQGLVEDSLKVTQELDELIKKRQEAELECKTAIPSLNYQQQNMRVCEVCTSLLGAQDNDRRLADHFGGKLHLGYIYVQEKLEELRNVLNTKTGRTNDEETSGSNGGNSRRRRSPERRSGKRERSRDRARQSRRWRSRSREYKRGSRSNQSDSPNPNRRYRN